MPNQKRKAQLKKKRHTAIDLFSGCGGLSQGLKDAGYDVLAAVEVDLKAQQTYSLNHPEVDLYCADIREIDPGAILRKLGLRKGGLDLIAGCPPCQGFSRLGTRNQQPSISDARNELVFEFLRFVEVMLPRTVMLENVPGLQADSRFSAVCVRLAELGYQTTSSVLNAADYNVPQRRKRLILLASRVHVPQLAHPSSQRITVRDALADVEEPGASQDQVHAVKENRSIAVCELIARIPKDGGSRSDLGDEAQLGCHRRTNGFYDVYGRMFWDDVAPTITSGCHNPSKGRFLHPDENRAITLREAAILQGFSRNYRFDVAHGKEAIALMIGNALPPPFIKAHAAELRAGADAAAS